MRSGSRSAVPCTITRPGVKRWALSSIVNSRWALESVEAPSDKWIIKLRNDPVLSSQSRYFFFFQAGDGIRAKLVTGVQTFALPIFPADLRAVRLLRAELPRSRGQLHQGRRSEEHTSELQSLAYLVCRLLLEKK